MGWMALKTASSPILGAATGIPASFICRKWNTCFTPSQAAAIKANYGPVRDPVTGDRIFSGHARGSEFDQIRFGYNLGPAPFGVASYALAFNNPNWDPSTFDLHTNLPILDQALGVTNAIDPDLKPFKRTGAKLIQWHEWDDAAFTPGWAVKYYREVSSSKRVMESSRKFRTSTACLCSLALGIAPKSQISDRTILVAKIRLRSLLIQSTISSVPWRRGLKRGAPRV